VETETCFKCDKPGTPDDAIKGPRSGGCVHIACLDPDLRELYLRTIAARSSSIPTT
jgi:hypothetical protein